MIASYPNPIRKKGGNCLAANRGDKGDVIVTSVACSMNLPFACISGWLRERGPVGGVGERKRERGEGGGRERDAFCIGE